MNGAAIPWMEGNTSTQLSETEIRAMAREAEMTSVAPMQQSRLFIFLKMLEKSYESEVAAVAVRNHLLQVLNLNVTRIESLPYPDAVLELIISEFARIRSVCATQANSYFRTENHSLVCDFRIALFSRIPVGPQHLEIGGIPRSLIYRGGLSQVVRFCRAWKQTGGFAPFYQCHMSHTVNSLNFLRLSGPEARDTMFGRIAECLRRNRHIRGMLSCSWLNDPRLDEISPHLSFFRTGVTDKGGLLFRYTIGTEGQKAAIKNSQKRTKLAVLGRYVPVEYIIVWPRRAALDWANNRERELTTFHQSHINARDIGAVTASSSDSQGPDEPT